MFSDHKFLCTGAFLYVLYSFMLISNKFCDLSLLHFPLFRARCGGGQCGKKYLLHWALEARYRFITRWNHPWELMVHNAPYVPLIETALYAMLLMGANPLHQKHQKHYLRGSINHRFLYSYYKDFLVENYTSMRCLGESPFAWVSTVSRGHPSLVCVIFLSKLGLAIPLKNAKCVSFNINIFWCKIRFIYLMVQKIG